MNILLINYEFPPLGAGASNATWNIGKELARMGNSITVLTSGYKKNMGYGLEEEMTVFRCPAIRKKTSESNILEMLLFIVSAFFFLPWIIVKHRTKGIIVFFSFPCGPLGLLSNLLFNIPYITSLRGGDVPGNEKKLDGMHRLLMPLRRLIYRKSKSVIANSNGLRFLAQKADKVDISVIPNGVDTDFFTPSLQKKKSKYFEFLFTGRLSEQKNLLFLLHQISVLKNNTEKEIKLHIAGKGPLENKLKTYAEKLEISDCITWYGWVDKHKILSLCHRADCFINPSFNEGMPNAVLEAMACGLPVIASSVAGNKDIIEDRQNGFLFNPMDSNQLQKIFTEIMNDSKLLSETGENARQTAKRDFSWQKAANDYLKLFQSKA